MTYFFPHIVYIRIGEIQLQFKQSEHFTCSSEGHEKFVKKDVLNSFHSSK